LATFYGALLEEQRRELPPSTPARQGQGPQGGELPPAVPPSFRADEVAHPHRGHGRRRRGARVHH
jgi:hypothetical protein